MAITHDALDYTIQGPPPPPVALAPLDIGPINTGPRPWSPRTCSNLFNLGLTVQEPPPGRHVQTYDKWAVRILLECFLDFSCKGAEINKRCKQLRDIVLAESKFNPEVIFRLLLNTGQLELKLKEVHLDMLMLFALIFTNKVIQSRRAGGRLLFIAITDVQKNVG